MNIRKILASVAYIAAMMLAAPAQATPINWTLQNVTFNDGGTASGIFSTDSITGGLLSYDLTTTAGLVLGGFHYYAADSHIVGNNIVGANSFLIASNANFSNPYINFSFINALNIAGTNSFTLNSSYECANCSPVRVIAPGATITSSAVPEPATLALFALGLFGFAAARRRKQ